MCTTSTPSRYHDPVKKSAVKKRLPRDGRRSSRRQLSFTESLANRDHRARLNAQLLQERERFVSREKEDEGGPALGEETAAATAIQAAARGSRARSSDISRELLELAEIAGLVPLRGVTLAPVVEKKTKKQWLEEKRRQHLVRVSAQKVQAASRRCIATKIVERMRLMKREERQKASVEAIQRFYRGHLARLDLLRKKSNTAAATIQNRYRFRMATKQHNIRRDMFERIARQQYAALKIQASSRAMFVRSNFLNVVLLRKVEAATTELTWQNDK